jgi:hypothetical protein
MAGGLFHAAIFGDDAQHARGCDDDEKGEDENGNETFQQGLDLRHRAVGAIHQTHQVAGKPFAPGRKIRKFGIRPLIARSRPPHVRHCPAFKMSPVIRSAAARI